MTVLIVLASARIVALSETRIAQEQERGGLQAAGDNGNSSQQVRGYEPSDKVHDEAPTPSRWKRIGAFQWKASTAHYIVQSLLTAI